MLRIAIIADDLTGALDAAAPFAGAGVAVATQPAALARALAAGAGVVAVSTRSRDIAPEAARERVAGVLAGLPAGIRVVKKIDSRLKGNVAAELAAFGAGRFVVLPAIPEFGRVVRGGKLSGFGLPAPLSVAAALGGAAARSRVPDTASQAEMAAAVRAAGDAILVGARGMAQALAAATGAAAAAPPPLAAPLAIVVGSTDPITLAQAAALRAAREDLDWLAAPSGVVPGGKGTGGLTLIQATPGRRRGLREVAAEFGRTVAPRLAGAASVVVTGGATAEAVFDALGIDCLAVSGEALPGMPQCRADGRVFVTKSGGFGAPDAFVRLAASAGARRLAAERGAI